LASNHRSDWAKLQEAVIHEREKDNRLLRTRSCGLYLAWASMKREKDTPRPIMVKTELWIPNLWLSLARSSVNP